MKYYKVKKSADQKTVCNITTKRVITTLFADELYTEKEINKKGLVIYSNYFDVVEISKKDTFFCFGVRKQCQLKTMQKETKLPLMYKGYILKRCSNGKISGYSYATDYFINPLYDTFEQIKLIIDNLKN